MKIGHKIVESARGPIEIYRLTNASGSSVVLSSLGAGILEVNVPDSQGRIENIALGYAMPEDYIGDGPCMGKTPGRYANRIGRGRFTIDGKEYNLAINNGPNALHGGPEGFQNRLWDSKADAEKGTVTFSRTSPDGEEGYPGALRVKVKYTWTESNQLIIDYTATTDAPTVVNLTNHAYWNLRAEYAGSALNHVLWLNASNYLPTDPDLLPTGEIAPVASSPMDFTRPKRISEEIHKPFSALEYGKGYDACWAIDNYEPGRLAHAASLRCELTGRTLDVYTTMPGVQVYTGNWLEGCPDSVSGHRYADYDGIAIECQRFPDAPNRPEFPSALLRPGEEFKERIVFAFTTL